MKPSRDHDGQCTCMPFSALMISRRLVPSASAIHNASPAEDPARMNEICRPSGDHRRPSSPASSILRGTPGSGAGSSHIAKEPTLSRGLAITATCVPSGEISRPPMPVVAEMSSPADAVKFAASPPATNLIQTSGFPLAFDTYATHFPSGEMAGPISRAGPLVRRTTREKRGGTAS